MYVSFLALFCSLLLTWLTLVTNRFHARFSNDTDLSGVQKYHLAPTPRIGGIPVFISFIIINYVCIKLNWGKSNNYFLGLILSSSIVFSIGVIEDINKKLSPYFRLLFMLIGGLIAIYVSHSLLVIQFAGFMWLNNLLSLFPLLGLGLTLFCVVGLTNAYNIIDGYNGLSAITAVLNLLGIAFLAGLVNNLIILHISLGVIGVILGFIAFNYPHGKIFLGDSGAYLLGFIIAILSINLAQINHDVISPYALLLMAIYPITEIGFSIYRRIVMQNTRWINPDSLHLHQLVYHRCISNTSKNLNAQVMPRMLFFMLPPTVFALLFYRSTIGCCIIIISYIVYYVMNYLNIVRFKTSRFLKLTKLTEIVKYD